MTYYGIISSAVLTGSKQNTTRKKGNTRGKKNNTNIGQPRHCGPLPIKKAKFDDIQELSKCYLVFPFFPDFFCRVE